MKIQWADGSTNNKGNKMKTCAWQEAMGFCDNLNYAGHKDWRLPTLKELHSLIDYSQNDPALPEGHPFVSVQSKYYWSSTSYAGNSSGAWDVNMDYGYVDGYYKENNGYVWPVRGGRYDEYGEIISQGCKPEERFTDNEDGTITDNRTGLVWIKDLDIK